MKKSLLAMVLAAATMPLIFAAQANQPAPAKTETAPPAKTSKMTKTTKAKKAKKPTKKGASKTTTAAPSTEKK